MATGTVLKEVIEDGQDFEWYPTTNEIILAVARDIKTKFSHGFSILDVGAGNGKVFNALDDYFNGDVTEEYNRRYIAKYAIEKSTRLVQELSADVFVIGSDFDEQTFFDKEMDIVFCNPPYSIFSNWAERLIKESNCKYLYLVIPVRWENDPAINYALELRRAKSTILGTYNFENSEDRKARATVHLIKIDFGACRSHHNYHNPDVDPFTVWFDEHFKLSAETEKNYDSFYKIREEITLIPKKELINQLVDFYDIEIKKLLDNYEKLQEIDGVLFKELNISIKDIMKSLRLKISGLKAFYWEELFKRLTAITNRLTSKTRKKMLDTLMSNLSVDFTKMNIYNIIIWALKNANSYFDSQILDVFFSLSNAENIKRYKSNNRLVTDRWRYLCDKNFSHYTLDYRIVIHHWSAFERDWRNDYKPCLSQTARDMINDLCTIGKNLGFDVIQRAEDYSWKAGKKCIFHYRDFGGVKEFAEVKGFKNGNLHIKLNKDFMKRLNIEASRLNGWIKSAQDIVDEFDDPEITMTDAVKMLGCNFQIPLSAGLAAIL